ncbi:peptidase U32 family protein [Streptobacillus notomytis]|uniref:peptidase U32 family protein n=1 Tax=Streptobacillus notomytis TaxID=1712031 RepID=UPI00082FDB6E|nr:U32 family peptidase [Streptobacillus notomytis]
MKIVGPAGNFEKLDAAIKAGADEVFLGLKGFGARRNNDNFAMKELLDGIDYAHKKGVKVLLALNTIMRDMEIKSVYKNFKPIYEHGVDAVIVQDFGLIKFLKANFPNLVLHGSTQMTVANHVEANYLKEIGLSRVVLARELSFEEIKEIREKTDIELEVFVSGSMCISYSGNCYVSSFIGGRSGNRGMCAYTCRKKFKDEEGKLSYFLSPNDQLLEEIEIKKLRDIGINAIKVEGRKKQPEYIYETVSYYRDVLNGISRKSESYKLFNRGYSKGYFYLDDKLMNHKYSSNFGYLLGRIEDNNDIKILDDLILGDGVQYVNQYFEKIDGVYVNKIYKNGTKVTNAEKGDTIRLQDIPKGTRYIYKNYSKEINDRINHNIKVQRRYKKINAKVVARLNEEIYIEFSTLNNFNKEIKVSFKGEILDSIANKKITEEDIINKLSELGDTDFEINYTDISYDGKVFIPFSKIKQIKRELVEKLSEQLISSYKNNDIGYIEFKYPKIDKLINPIFSALCRTDDQEYVCRKLGITKIYRENFDIAKQKNISNSLLNQNTNLVSNLYQLIKGKENGIKNQAINWNFNVFNNLSIDVYSNFDNVDTVFLSPELNYKQLKLITNTSLKRGLVIYGSLKTMYIEHTIYEKRYKEIQGEHFDRYKVVKNDLNNIELYLYKPMNLIPKLDLIYSLNLDELRLDFTFESKEEVEKIIKSLKTKTGKYNPYAFDMGVS